MRHNRSLVSSGDKLSASVSLPNFKLCVFIESPDTFIVHASGTGQLHAKNTGLRLPSGKRTQRAVTTMRSNNLVEGEDHLLGLSCLEYNWQTSR